MKLDSIGRPYPKLLSCLQQRRRLTKGFCHDDDGDQKYPLACPAFEEWDMTKAMQEMHCSIWDAGQKGIYCAHIEHVLHKVGGDRHGERVDRIEDSCPHLSSDKPGAKVCASFKLLIHVMKCRVLHMELDKYYEM